MSLIQQISLPIAGTDGSWKLKITEIGSNYDALSVTPDGKCMYASAYIRSSSSPICYFYSSSDYGKTWLSTVVNFAIKQIDCSDDGSRLVIVVDTGVISNPANRILVSFDFGASWQSTFFTSLATGTNPTAFSSSDLGIIYVTRNLATIFRSYDFGNTFTELNPGTGVAVKYSACSSDGRYVYVSQARSVDYGNTWIPMSQIFSRVKCSRDGRYVIGVNTAVISSGGGLVYSKDYGVSWTRLFAVNEDHIQDFYAISDDGRQIIYQQYLFDGTTYQKLYSNDFGVTFTNMIIDGLGNSSAGNLEVSSDMSVMALSGPVRVFNGE